MTDPDTPAAEALPDGLMVYLKPGAAALTAEERETLGEYARFLRERKEILDRYQGEERDARLAELAEAYEAAATAKPPSLSRVQLETLIAISRGEVSMPDYATVELGTWRVGGPRGRAVTLTVRSLIRSGYARAAADAVEGRRHAAATAAGHEAISREASVDADQEALYTATAPILDQAVRAGWARDVPGIDLALARAVRLGEAETFYAAAMLASLAVDGLELPPGADGFMPLVVRRGVTVDPDAPENAPAAFLGRFLVAAHAKDEDQAIALWRPLWEAARPPCGTPAGRQMLGMVWRLLVSAALDGHARRKRARQKAAAHPRARRDARRTHRGGRR